ncbi:MAG: hypothetical protein JNM89_08885 [Hyphomicrobiaceae bacterium]|nr:hypothetical protein [Hyphomicrobiaceae bacterium]
MQRCETFRRDAHSRGRPWNPIWSPACLLAASLIALAAAPGAVEAEPLPPEACEGMRRELATLENGAAAASVARGPEWAKANLTPEQIGLVSQLIALREQVLFRCRPTLIETETPPAAIDPEKVPLPEPNTVLRATIAANPPPPAAEKSAPASAAKTGAATTAAEPPVPQRPAPTPAARQSSSGKPAPAHPPAAAALKSGEPKPVARQ